MRLRWLEFKFRLRKAVLLGLVPAALLSLLYIAGPGMASTGCGTGIQGVPSDTLVIKVGYFGGPYYTKKVYTLSDFDQLSQVKQAYTFIDSMPSVCMDAATGVRLTDLLADAGIDVNSVQKFYFYATDIRKGWYQCLDKSYLLDTPRYYYPNLPAGWDYEKGSSTLEAVYGAIRVDPIIAYKDNWQRYGEVPDFSVYDTSTRFRLLFGQKEPDECTAPQSAKWVHSIDVMLGGMPPAGVTLDQNAVNLKVGSTVRLTATVAPYEATDKSVTWSSSDPGVATVDHNGLVTVVGPGAATIAVSTVVGNLTATCIVNGPRETGPGQSSEPFGAGPQKNGEVDNPFGLPVSEDNRQHLAKKEITAAVSTAAPAASEQSGSQPWRVYEMSSDAVPLQQQKRQNTLDIFAAVLLGVLLLGGSGKRYMEHIREVVR
ncbi:Ig domain protein group 2 domain protein [Desulfofarcimen acetoxidans DSM 771]|uniref:Ig domain protein group 2 domain protein n=1 Tax=Desulfofarcimen acetoxidans (strain ATCC 49208 / DSM 771 / KCTC 5769 / VKM B-1644 / 5575) TaxID=485916 RepID=C8W6U8_DESAS|nr:Ig-like domain-containing protein [Desulfofarcimen acetoxidans]ACV64207.1 Ig domain protein group 2 domain protein [Desulfofarcimen acetoxidans DSM 771]